MLRATSEALTIVTISRDQNQCKSDSTDKGSERKNSACEKLLGQVFPAVQAQVLVVLPWQMQATQSLEARLHRTQP